MGRTAGLPRIVVALGGVALAVVTVAACGTTDEASRETLPPMVTTTSTTTTSTTVPQDRFYTIERGDTLAVIAAKFGVTVQSVIDLNQIENPDSIAAGQVIEIPANER